MDLSIIIVNWNGVEVLGDCLRSIFNDPPPIAFEVILVDNGSTDGSVSFVQARFPDVKLVGNTQNVGFAMANNQGFARATGLYVLLLNSDTVVNRAALQLSVEYLQANVTVGALGCRVEFPDGSFQTSCYRFNGLRSLFMVRLLPLGSIAGERLNYSRYWARQFDVPTQVEVVAGCFMMVRKEVITQVGGLDEAFFMYGEDEEWCSRIIDAGWKVVYLPAARIIHVHRFSSRKLRRTLRVTEQLSPVFVLLKRRGVLVAWLGNAILTGGMIVRLPLWIAQDFLHLAKGTATPGLIMSRFSAIAAHLKIVISPGKLHPYLAEVNKPQ